MSETYITRAGLIAPESATKGYEGAGIFESVSGMVDNFANEDWFGFGGNLAATGLSALGTVMDPLQSLFAAGVGWLMEHVSILREPLDLLCGDPKAIEGHAATWRNIEKRIYDATDHFADEVNSTTRAWTAGAAEAYRLRARDHAETIQALGKIADGMGTATTILGAIVGVARNTIRDIIAQVVGAIISKALQATTAVLIPKVVTEVSLLVFDTSTKILNVLKGLVTQIQKVAASVGKLQEYLTIIRQSNDKVLFLVSHRLQAANAAHVGWSGWRESYSLLSHADVAVYGPMRQVLINTGRSAAQTNTSQNTGSAADSTVNPDFDPEPKPIDIPL